MSNKTRVGPMTYYDREVFRQAREAAQRPEYWAFEVRFRARGSRRESVLNDSVACETQVEARRWMLTAIADVERRGGRVLEFHTYRQELS